MQQPWEAASFQMWLPHHDWRAISGSKKCTRAIERNILISVLDLFQLEYMSQFNPSTMLSPVSILLSTFDVALFFLHLLVLLSLKLIPSFAHADIDTNSADISESCSHSKTIVNLNLANHILYTQFWRAQKTLWAMRNCQLPFCFHRTPFELWTQIDSIDKPKISNRLANRQKCFKSILIFRIR